MGDGQMVLKDVCARASGERHRMAARRCQVGSVWFPNVARKHKPFSEILWRYQTPWCEDHAAYRGMQGEKKKDWMWREKSRGRVNISYTYYQTELLISIPSKPPQVMLKRIRGNHGGCEFLLQTGDLNSNKLWKNYRKNKSKTSW